MNDQKSNSVKRISKKQWLSKALEMLKARGVESVKIERLASGLGISRSGFYWHFKNRQDLLEHLLDYWVNEYTGVVTDNPDVVKLDPDKRLLVVMKMIRQNKLSEFDLAIHAWARVDPLAHKVLTRALKTRFEFIHSIFAEIGFEGDELEMRTRLFVCYHSWEATSFPELSSQKHSRLQQLRHAFFIR